jgi:hypothetical protein
MPVWTLKKPLKPKPAKPANRVPPKNDCPKPANNPISRLKPWPILTRNIVAGFHPQNDTLNLPMKSEVGTTTGINVSRRKSLIANRSGIVSGRLRPAIDNHEEPFIALDCIFFIITRRGMPFPRKCQDAFRCSSHLCPSGKPANSIFGVRVSRVAPGDQESVMSW